MPGDVWNQRFDNAMAKESARQAGYDEVRSAGANPLVVRMLLKNAWSPGADFPAEHRRTFAVALTAGETVFAGINELREGIDKFSEAMRQALRQEPEGLEFFERFNPLLPLGIQLSDCALWIEAHALPALGKHVSGAELSKRRRGKKGRTKQPILRALDVYTVTLLAYLRLIDNKPHSNAVARLLNAAAEASGVAVHWRLDGHWVSVTEKRFQTERSRLYEVVKRRVAIYCRKGSMAQ